VRVNRAPKHVMKEMCSTCIFRPGNLMHLRPGRLADMIKQCQRDDTNVICHKSESLQGILPVDAWCRGSVDHSPGQLVRIFGRMGGLEEVEEPKDMGEG